MMTEKNIGGNYFDKYNSKNPVVKILMKNFYKTFFDILKNENIDNMIDVGCGEGYLTNLLGEFFEKNNRDVKITALEYNNETVLFANKIHPSLNIKQGDILNLNGRYDLLISSEVLEHIEDFEKALENCKQVSSICIFSVPNEPWWRIVNVCRLKYLKRLGNTPGHINHWSRKKFYKLLKKHFKDVKVKTTGLWNVAICKKPI